MITVQREVETSTPLATVAAFLSDFTSTARWDPHTVSCERIDAGPLRVGARYRNVQRIAGSASALDYELVDYVPDRQVRLVGSGQHLRATDSMRFRPGADGGTHVTYRADFRFSGPMRLATPVLRVLLNRIADDGAKGMRRTLAAL